MNVGENKHCLSYILLSSFNMTQPIFPDDHTRANISAFPHPKFITRTRRETNTIDTVNARQFEHWQTAGKTYNRPDLNKQAPFYDVMPNNSRGNDQNYRSQPRYEVKEDKGVQNPFFDKYDTTSDSRNMTRELRASVYEDKHSEYTKESKKMMERNFDNRWLDSDVMLQQAEAAQSLRPKMDDIRLFYHNKPIEKK
jgi:hypothetical protein